MIDTLIKSPVGILVGMGATLFIIREVRAWFGGNYQDKIVTAVTAIAKTQEKLVDNVVNGFASVTKEHNEIISGINASYEKHVSNHNRIGKMESYLNIISVEAHKQSEDTADITKESRDSFKDLTRTLSDLKLGAK
jgi:hypothetical protein